MNALLLLLLIVPASADELTVGSKKFTESVILGDVCAGRLSASGATVKHIAELGGSRVLFDGLVAGELDAYVEYSGTLLHELLPGPDPDGQLAALGLARTGELGFNNTYAMGMVRARATELGIASISDLAGHPDLQLGFGHEFLDRADGWPLLQQTYGLPQTPRGLDHDLAYKGLNGGVLDVVDLYSTDAEIAQYDLAVLTDDRQMFPEYRAFVLHRADLPADAIAALRSLAGTVDGPTMVAMNRAARVDGVPSAQVAADFLGSLGVAVAPVAVESAAARMARHGRRHVVLVGSSLALALLVALPLGVLAASRPKLGQAVLAGVGVLQTVPSLALLVLMIPLLGIGPMPAIAALFLYSLLPIVRNTHAGLTGIDPALRESAIALGLPPRARLLQVELPLATPSILAGVQTAAVLNVGTATLGALIGAGGLGEPILTGIRLDDVSLILQGALPAAALALLVQAGFEGLGRLVIPAGLQPSRGETRP